MKTEPEIIALPGAGGSMTALLVRGASSRLCVVAHGRNGAADAPHVAAIAAAYVARGWTVLAPHLRCSDANPSPGAGRDFTLAGMIGDVGAAAAWATAQEVRALAFAGHSAGAYAAARVAAQTTATIHLLGVSPVIGGAALLEARRRLGPDAVAALEREAPLAFAEWPQHDARPALAALAAPVAAIVGALDGLTPPPDARDWFNAASDGRFFSVLPEQHHCPCGARYSRALEAALDALDA